MSTDLRASSERGSVHSCIFETLECGSGIDRATEGSSIAGVHFALRSCLVSVLKVSHVPSRVSSRGIWQDENCVSQEAREPSNDTA